MDSISKDLKFAVRGLLKRPGFTVIALVALDLLVELSANSIPPIVNVKIDATVLGFTLLISIVTGVLFGLAPAFRTSKVNLSDALKEGLRGEGQNALRSRTRSTLVIFESAIAVVLLIGAGFLIRSLVALQGVNPGFDASNILTLRVDLPRQKYNSAEKSGNFFQELETRVAGLPGVEAAGLVTELPLSGQLNDLPFTVEGRPPVTPDQPISPMQMTDWVEPSVAAPRYRTTLLRLFAALAMILAATGTYGVMSYSVAQRTHEIGVRMALGARRADVLKLVVGQGMSLTVIGVVLELLAALALTRVMASLLLGVTATDPITFSVVAALSITVAFIACVVPARRATKVDPLVTLRYE